MRAVSGFKNHHFLITAIACAFLFAPASVYAGRFSCWWGGVGKSKRQKKAGSPIQGPEPLEDRTVPTTLSYQGGPILPLGFGLATINARQDWDPSATVKPIVEGSYLGMLGQSFPGVGAGKVNGEVNTAPLPGTVVTNQQIQDQIMAEIGSGAVPPPGPNQMYFYFMPPGQAVSNLWGDKSVAGFHSVFALPDGTNVYYAVAYGYPSYQMAQIISHETAETVTDPTPPTGWMNWDAQAETADVREWQPWRYYGPGFSLNVSTLTAPDGHPIVGPPPPSDFFHQEVLALEVATADMFNLLARIYPQFFASAAFNANHALDLDPLYNAPGAPGLPGQNLGDYLFYNALQEH